MRPIQIKKTPKYRNKKVKADGYTFDSRREYERYCELKLLEKAGEISAINVHPKFDLELNGIKLGTYSADFKYAQPKEPWFKCEDVKSPATAKLPLFKLKCKLMKALYGIDVEVVY